MYILYLSMTLTFDTYVGGGAVSLVGFTHSFILFQIEMEPIFDSAFIYLFNFQFNLVCDNVFLRSNLKISYLVGFFVASMVSQLSDVYVLVKTRQDYT